MANKITFEIIAKALGFKNADQAVKGFSGRMKSFGAQLVTVGAVYKVSFSTKVNEGSVRWDAGYLSNIYHAPVLTSTSFINQEIVFRATDADTCGCAPITTLLAYISALELMSPVVCTLENEPVDGVIISPLALMSPVILSSVPASAKFKVEVLSVEL